jgi:hypothetical protein
MNEQEQLKKISLSPFSCTSLPLINEALQAIRRRYPNSNSKTRTLANSQSRLTSSSTSIEEQTSPADASIPTFHAEPSWIEFTQWVSQLPVGVGDGPITPSTLRLANGDHLDTHVVDSYLKLIRADSPCAKIVDVRELRHDCNEIGDEGVHLATIMPFQDGDGWAFAVAYPDCIHWYDSRPSADIPVFRVRDKRPVVDDWTGPKEFKPTDSGVLMLLGIRRLQHGIPHLDQSAANRSGPAYRSRILIELLCGKLNPTTSELESLVARVRQEQGQGQGQGQEQGLEQQREQEQEGGEAEQSHFFDDATYGMDFEAGEEAEVPFATNTASVAIITPPDSTLDPSPRRIRQSQPENEASIHVSAPVLGSGLPAAQSRPAQQASPHGRENGTDVVTAEEGLPVFRWRHVVQPCPLEDRQVILRHLSQAVKASREVGASMQTGLPVLWSLVSRDRVSKDGVSSAFHQRYNAVLFHDKMEQLHSSTAVEQAWGSNGLWDRPGVKEMRLMQTSCRFWRELCDLRSEWGDGKYTMLLVGSKSLIDNMSRVQRNAFVATIRSRLADVSDPLAGCLESARGLCCAIVNKSLPEETLMIDRYPLRHHDGLNDPFIYGAFTSLNPRVKVPIPRPTRTHSRR